LYASSHDDTTNTTCSMQMSNTRPASGSSNESSKIASIFVEHVILAVDKNPNSKDSFWRTKLCCFNDSGTCYQGNSCTFAHGGGQLRGGAGRLADEISLGKTPQVLASFTDKISCDQWNAQTLEEAQPPQPNYNAGKVVVGLPPAVFTGEDGDIVVKNTFLSVIPRRPSRRCFHGHLVMGHECRSMTTTFLDKTRSVASSFCWHLQLPQYLLPFIMQDKLFPVAFIDAHSRFELWVHSIGAHSWKRTPNKSYHLLWTRGTHCMKISLDVHGGHFKTLSGGLESATYFLTRECGDPILTTTRYTHLI